MECVGHGDDRADGFGGSHAEQDDPACEPFASLEVVSRRHSTEFDQRGCVRVKDSVGGGGIEVAERLLSRVCLRLGGVEDGAQ